MKAYKQYVNACGSYPDLKNVPQYMLLVPDEQDELAIELVPFLKRIIQRNKVSRKKFAIIAASALTRHEFSVKLDEEIKGINPYFDGDMYGIIRKSLEYLRRGLPTLRDDKIGAINLFNYEDFVMSISRMKNAWQNQEFATLFFFHPESDRDRFEKVLNELRKNIPQLVKVAKILNISGLRLYRMEFIKFYEMVMENIFQQMEVSPPPMLKKLLQEYFFFLKNDIGSGEDKMKYPDFAALLAARQGFNPGINSLNALFMKDRKLLFTREGKYWRLPALPEEFWKLPLLKISSE